MTTTPPSGAEHDTDAGHRSRTNASDSNEERDTPSSTGRRRRRRGRRGRGRGRGGGAASTSGAGGTESDAPDTKAPDTEAPETEKSADDASGVGTSAPRRSSSHVPASRGRSPSRRQAGAGTSDEAATRPGGGTPAETDTDPADASGGAGGSPEPDGEDARVEASIARDGTRVAAKRGGRRGGGSGRRGDQRPVGVSEEVRRAILEGPPRTMLVSSRRDRTQIAVLEDRTVVEHYVTRKEDVTYVGNIYMARVQNVLPGMEAAFLDIGKGRNGVLYAGEVLFDELDLEEGTDQRIENALKPGQKVLVQVTKDPMGSKGPRLTMHLSLAGRYLVLAPGSDLFGISRKLTERERDRLRRIVKRVKPDEHGVIVRTAAEGATDEQICADVARLLAKWERVAAQADDAKALTAVYEEPSLVVKVIRDTFGPEFERCIVDDEDLYQQVRDYLEEVAPELLEKVTLYGAPDAGAAERAAGVPLSEVGATGDPEAAGDDGAVAVAGGDGDGAAATAAGTGPVPVDLAAAAARRATLPELFDAYDVAEQLRKAMGRKVWLPSGGYLIIEVTEAMKVIDVNTGKFTGGKDTSLEEVVLKTNLEAADEIVRQLRLRDMGGIIVIDFIDMLLKANQEQVVRRLKRELLRDRTKTRVSEVSRLGLVQMTRKNVSQGLVESFSHTCEACEGRGVISELE